MSNSDDYIYKIFKPEIINAYENTKDQINDELINEQVTKEEILSSLNELNKVDVSTLTLDIDKYMHTAMKQILQEIIDNN